MCLSSIPSHVTSRIRALALRLSDSEFAMGLHVDRRRVGVIGIQQSGKTAFLTSLIDHLRWHDPKVFRLGENRSWSIRGFQTLGNADGTPNFSYVKHRNQLQEGRWPIKTCDSSEYRCRFDCSGGHFGNRLESWTGHTELSLIDLPGERIADLDMAAASYSDWSDCLLRRMDEHPAYETEFEHYRAILDQDNPVEAATIIGLYKQAVGRVAFKGLPLVVPSTMLVSAEGRYIPKSILQARDHQALADAHLSGCGPNAEFAPLSAKYRTLHPGLVKEFERHFRRYCAEMVEPFVRRLYSCDQLVILVDIPTLLAGGAIAFNACRHVLEATLANLSIGRTSTGSVLDRTVRFLTLGRRRLNGWVGSIRRVAVVATQADRVHSEDQPALRSLAHDLVEPLLVDAGKGRSFAVDYFFCAAVDSSVSREIPKIEVRSGPGEETMTVAVSRVPATWPRNWKAGDHHFPQFPPAFAPLAGVPSPHIGLNKVAAYILGIQ
jgi:predicted YcjX-like family ATPase